MNVLTPLFVVYYIYQLFTQNKAFRKFANKYDGLSFEYFDNKIVEDKEFFKDLLKYFSCTVFYLLVMLIEFIYICNAFVIDKHVTLTYFVFWLLVFIAGIARLNLGKKKTHIKGYGFKIHVFIYNLIDLSFFGYMFYMLFIK